MKTFKNQKELREYFDQIFQGQCEQMRTMLQIMDDMNRFAEGIKERSLLYC